MATKQSPTGTALPPITIAPLNDFRANPPQLFFHRTQNDSYAPDPEKSNFCYTTGNNESVLRVSNEEELEKLCNNLLNYPIFFNVKFDKESWTVIPCPFVTYIGRNYVKGEYVVTLWPQHPVIQPQLLAALNTARQEMAADKQFAIDLSFRKILKDWFEDHVVDKAQGCFSCHYGKKLRICITNKKMYNNAYRCICPENCLYWTFCCPCWFLASPIYRVCRSNVSDHEFEIEGNVGTLVRIKATTQRGQMYDKYMITTQDGRQIEDIRYTNQQTGIVTVSQQPGNSPEPRDVDQGATATNKEDDNGHAAATSTSPATIITSYIGVETMEDSVPETTADKANLL
ncbi:uncharacterized protein [Amphiura filiformis]|uniref:uncharacterized protein n=1 Tax=Amphiura filiformis TaxID=82378 RepID=UPI003B228F36